MPQARHATAADAGVLGAALAAAFATDPLWQWIVGDADRWEQRAAPVFAHEVRSRLRLGHAYTTDERSGVALWAPPGLWRTAARDLVRTALPMGRLTGLAGARRGLGVVGTIERSHPRSDHWYLAVLGTHPDHQGTGAGSAMLEPVLHRCDLDGTPAYLESSNPDNVAFYRRHGFEVTGQVSAKDGPPLDLMWREPQPVEPR